MTQILLDANLAGKLRASDHTVQLCDPNGDVVGLFTPRNNLKIPFSEREIQESKQKSGGRPLADILADLEKA